PKQRRRPIMVTLALGLSLASTLFFASLVVIPLLPVIKLPKPSFARDLDLSNPALTSREAERWLPAPGAQRAPGLPARQWRPRASSQRSTRPPLTGAESREPEASIRRPVVAAYYVDWDETSLASLKAHADELTHLMPEWLHLNRDARSFTSELK